MVICMVFCIDSVAGIMPIITCPGCNSTNTCFCHEKGFVEHTRFCCKTGFIANMRLFGFVWCRLLCRHLGFDSDFAQISGLSGLRIGGWHLWSQAGTPSCPESVEYWLNMVEYWISRPWGLVGPLWDHWKAPQTAIFNQLGNIWQTIKQKLKI